MILGRPSPASAAHSAARRVLSALYYPHGEYYPTAPSYFGPSGYDDMATGYDMASFSAYRARGLRGSGGGGIGDGGGAVGGDIHTFRSGLRQSNTTVAGGMGVEAGSEEGDELLHALEEVSG